MAARRVTTVTCADDMHRLKGYKTLKDFIEHVQGQTDLEVELEVDDSGVYVTQLGGGLGQMTFAYPFAVQDIVKWTYHWENDNSIRYEVYSDVENILDVPVREGETLNEETAEELKEERTESVLAFVQELLWGDRWIDLDGIDLLIMDPEGGPLELTATFEWLTPTTGGISRPCRPADRPAVARLYCDGRLALAWPSEADDPDQDGVERPLRDLVVVDLANADDPLDLYDEAYETFWTAVNLHKTPASASLSMTQAGFREAKRRIAAVGGSTRLDLGGLGLTDSDLWALRSLIHSLKALTDLRLHDNRLTVLPKSIGNLSALTLLGLSGNQLKVLPKSIGNLTALTDLSLSNNQLSALPRAIGNLTGLTFLDVSGNELTVLPKSIGKLTALITLDLGWNRLTALPETIGNLTNLTTLWPHDNYLTALPKAIGNLTNLTDLDVSSNELTRLPKVIGNLTNLTTLGLRGNQLTTLPGAIGNLTSLTRLWLSENQLTVLPEAIGGLTSVTTLGLDGNQLRSLPKAIGNLTHLTDLDVSSNALSSLPETISNLTALTTVGLSHNHLTTLPEGIGNLTALTTLGLSDNDLDSLPEAIGKLTALISLDVSNNPLSSRPGAGLEEGGESELEAEDMEDEDEEGGLTREDLEKMDLKELRVIAKEEGVVTRGLDQDALVDAIMGEDEEVEDDEEDDADVEEPDEDALNAMSLMELRKLAKEIDLSVKMPLTAKTSAAKSKVYVNAILSSAEA